jgi:cell division septum initiation protein DivIVA
MASRKDERKDQRNNEQEVSAEEAKKEADQIATLAESKKAREEATTIAKKLEAVVNKKEEEQPQYTKTQVELSQQEIRQAITKALDEAKDNTKRAVDQAKREIPHYTQIANDYQEQAIQAVREMVDNYIDTQKEIINSFQKSSWFPYIENTYGMHYWTTTFLSPRRMTEIYANMVSSFADNMVSATRLANNMIFANMETIKTITQQAKDNAKDMSRISVNTAKTFENVSRETLEQK